MSLFALTLPARIVIGGLLSRRSMDAGLSEEVSGRGVYGWPTQVVGHDELVVGKRNATRVEFVIQSREAVP